jgi:hypothetical protein
MSPRCTAAAWASGVTLAAVILTPQQATASPPAAVLSAAEVENLASALSAELPDAVAGAYYDTEPSGLCSMSSTRTPQRRSARRVRNRKSCGAGGAG